MIKKLRALLARYRRPSGSGRHAARKSGKHSGQLTVSMIVTRLSLTRVAESYFASYLVRYTAIV